MKPIIGLMNAIESREDYVRKPTDTEWFLAPVIAMLENARVLTVTAGVPAITLFHLCSHAMEVALKAMLAQTGYSSNHLKSIGRDSANIWVLAEAENLPLPGSTPPWFDQNCTGCMTKPFVYMLSTGFS